MKKLLFIISAFLFIGLSIYSADTERATKTLSSSVTIHEWSLGAADTLTANQDSIVYSWILNKEYPVQYAIYIDADTIAGIDTTMTVQVLGKRFSAQDWTQISSTSITAFQDTAFEITSQNEPTYTLTFATSTDTFLIDTTALSYAFTTVASADSAAFYKATIERVASTASMVPAAIAQYYRYFAVRLSLPGDDNTGSGYTINTLILKIWKREY